MLLPFAGVEPMGITKKQLICGFSVVLLGSGSAESDPAITFQISRLSTPGGPATVVYRRNPCVPRSREREKRPTGA